MSKVKLILIALCLFVLVGCSPESPKKNGETKTSESNYKVALLTGSGGLGDRSFNDMAWQGLQRAEKELDVEVSVVENQSYSDYATALKSVADAGFNLVITVGNDWGDVLTSLAPQYPNTWFAGVNIDVTGDNVSIIRFADHEGSFLAGYLAAKFSKTSHIGFLGGADAPAINRFFVGYEEGAKKANPNVEITSSYVGSFSDPGKGKEFALQIYNSGADVIFGVAGKTGEGLFEAVKEKADLFAIGVDQNQDYIVEGKVLSSMMKRLDNAVFNLVGQLKSSKLKAETQIYGLAEEGVGLTDFKFTKDVIGEEILKELETVKQQIIDGEIKVTDLFE